MSRFSRMMYLFAVPVLFAACSPGSTDTPFAPAAPRHDGGGLLVGGNYVPPDSTQTGSSTSTTSSDAGGTVDDSGAEPGVTSRSGGLLVGGN